MNDNIPESNQNLPPSHQSQIEIPPSPDLPVSIPEALLLPHWLLAILLVSAISKRFYQTALVIREIVRIWKKPAADEQKQKCNSEPQGSPSSER